MIPLIIATNPVSVEKHISKAIFGSFSDFLFEPVISYLIPEISRLNDYDQKLFADAFGEDSRKNLQGIVGTNLGKVIKEIKRAKVVENYQKKLSSKELKQLPENYFASEKKPLDLKWAEHRSWIQIKAGILLGSEKTNAIKLTAMLC